MTTMIASSYKRVNVSKHNKQICKPKETDANHPCVCVCVTQQAIDSQKYPLDPQRFPGSSSTPPEMRVHPQLKAHSTPMHLPLRTCARWWLGNQDIAGCSRRQATQIAALHSNPSRNRAQNRA